MKDELVVEQYRQLRKEVTVRVKLLHDLIGLAVILVFFGIGTSLFIWNFLGQTMFINYILGLSLVFTFLLFNYQSNQMTLEAVARYSNNIIKDKIEHHSWDHAYGQHKKQQRLISFSKTAALWLPSLAIILGLLLQATVHLAPYQSYLLLADLIAYLISMYNFRYKI